MFSVMLCVFISDFLARGYEDKNFVNIPIQDITNYQVEILFIFSATLFFASLIKDKQTEAMTATAMTRISMGPQIRRTIYLVCLALLAAELFKRFSSVNWSISEVFLQSLAPRGQRTWDIAGFSGNFVFALLRSLLPFTGIGLGYLIANSKTRISSLAYIIPWTFIIFLLVTDGSRTPVVMNLAALWLFLMIRLRGYTLRVVTSVISSLVVAALTSLMYLYRSSGFLVENERAFQLTYHQDDSYYRTIYSFFWSDVSTETWNFMTFFGAILANPIPRAIWPGKPLLDAQFFGGYKLHYVTNLYLGELVAIFGSTAIIFFGPIFGLLIYLVLYRSARLLRHPLGIGAYLLVALYAYMSLRSLFNTMGFIYLPAFAIAVVLYLGGRRAKQMARNRYA